MGHQKKHIEPKWALAFSQAIASFRNWHDLKTAILEPVSIDLRELNGRPITCLDVETICSYVMKFDGQMHKNEYDALLQLAKHISKVDGPADQSYTNGAGFLWDLVIHEQRIRIMQKQYEFDIGFNSKS